MDEEGVKALHERGVLHSPLHAFTHVRSTLMARIKKGDTVAVLSGKDRGKSGKVLRIWPDQNRALVERINLLKHFDRRSQQNQAGGIIEREGAMALSKLALVCPRCRKPSRIGWLMTDGGGKQRICRRCQEIVT